MTEFAETDFEKFFVVGKFYEDSEIKQKIKEEFYLANVKQAGTGVEKPELIGKSLDSRLYVELRKNPRRVISDWKDLDKLVLSRQRLSGLPKHELPLYDITFEEVVPHGTLGLTTVILLTANIFGYQCISNELDDFEPV